MRSRPSRPRWLLVPAALVVLVTASMLTPGVATGEAPPTAQAVTQDLDTRAGALAPSSTQLDAVRSMGATATWTRFGTPATLFNRDGFVATGLSGTPAQAARSWIESNRSLFRLTAAEAGALEMISDTTLEGTTAHVVMFRQRFGGLPAGHDGLITVGIKGGNIAYVSSSAAGSQGTPAAATLSAPEAWLAAAEQAGLSRTASDVSGVRQEGGWTLFDVTGLGEQRARLVAVPTPTSGAKAAFEVNVVDTSRADPLAFISFVDARSGDVLVSSDRVDHLALFAPTAGTYSGSTGAGGACGSNHEFEAAIGTQTISIAASADNPINDIVLELVYVETNTVVASADTGTSPEAVEYQVPVGQYGTYAARVCPFNSGDAPFPYHGTYATQDIAGTSGFPYPPRWKVFPANPPLDLSSTDTRVLWCWVNVGPECAMALENLAARVPWDYDPNANTPTFTTKGNAAVAGEAWFSPLTPAEQYRPVDLQRNYSFPWTNQWYTSKCSQSSFGSPQRNDIDAATTNLFAMHNRMHDWSYFLGFTEEHWNMQQSNFGLGEDQNDPETGNSQAGAVNGGAPSYTGRDNANQITLQDGIPPITNMYLWQPIAAAFYSPCVDGDYDMSVIGHEYTHAISNRMVGGPDANLTGPQARAMGESWSDLTAVEYLNEYGFVPTGGENPFAVGPYATGDKVAGIRNYNMSMSPLNFSDMTYDFVCDPSLVGPPLEPPCAGPVQPHADGEIWSAINFDIRQALIAKYNGSFPASDASLQRQCADGELPVTQCPGNRRWIQLVFDSFLLMPSRVSFVEARDALLAADQLRFGGANQTELWRVFAQRGIGQNAFSDTNADPQPRPSFETPKETNEATVTFNLRDAGTLAAVPGEVYVGRYEARVTPIADTDPGSSLAPTAKFVPGTYEFIARANGYGAFRFTQTFAAGETKTVQVNLATNQASKAKGASAAGDGVNLEDLIDDTEASNWYAAGRNPSVQGTKVTVDLAGSTATTVRRVQVSAMLRPADPDNEPADPGNQNRFTALRQFEIWACVASTANANCSGDAGFTKIYTSPADAFPATAPRPRAPNLLLKEFDVPDTSATHLRLVVVTNQCTGGPAYQGDQDNDPSNNSDCPSGSTRDNEVRAAELQAFSTASSLGAGGGGGGGGGSLGFTGHAHSDLNNNGQAGEQDVHVFAGSTGVHGTTGNVAGYWDMRGNPPGIATSNFHCTGTPNTSSRSGNVLTITGTIVCSGFSPAKTFTLTITDNGPNPPSSDGYRMVLRNKNNQVVYDYTGTTTVGMGDLVVT